MSVSFFLYTAFNSLPRFSTNVIAGGVHECEEAWVARAKFGMVIHSKAEVRGKVGETIHQNVPR
jgi:hypothetical protein